MRFTKAGFEQMRAELEDLKARRPAAIEDLKKARELGDLKENGYYQASKRKLGFIDSRMTRLSYDLRNGIIVADKPADAIGIGSTVSLSGGKNEMVYHVVGDLEADPSAGKISLNSPLGSAISGHKKGDTIVFETPRGKVSYTITKIE